MLKTNILNAKCEEVFLENLVVYMIHCKVTKTGDIEFIKKKEFRPTLARPKSVTQM